MNALPPRTAWRVGFPRVIVHAQVSVRDRHALYAAAKAGDSRAAILLATDLLSANAVGMIRSVTSEDQPYLLPVTALEQTGFNAIPDGMARVLGAELGLQLAPGAIVQSNKVGHTRAPAFNRIVTPAAFLGEAEPGRTYFLVDDHVGLGGTLANLKGHIESAGARVSGMTTLTQSRDADQIAIAPATSTMLWMRHGQAIDDFWRDSFGHGIDCLTDIEGQLLCREPTLNSIRDRLAQAAIEARRRGLRPALPDTSGVEHEG